MKESKAVYVRKRDFNVELNREYQFYATNIIRDGEYLPQPARYGQKSHEVGCQYDCKRNNLTCTYRYLNTPRRKQEIRYFGSPKQIYSYQGSRSFTDIGVGSVKALQRKKVKRIYLPETNERGVGNSDWSSYILQRTKPQHQHKDSYYENKRTSSKCVGGILEYNIGCVINEKLSPIIQTISGSTSYTDFNFNKNIEVGSSANAKIFINTSTQVANLITRDVEIEAEVVERKITKDTEVEIEKEQPRDKQIEKIAKPTIMTKAVPKELNTIAVAPRKPVKPQVIPPERVSSDSLRKLVKTKEKPTEEESSTESTRKRAKPKEKPTDSSSDSLLQHIHNLENPSLERNSRMSLEAEDLMENKLELEYRSIFAAKSKSKDSKNSARNSEIKSTSTLRRRFEALRRGLAKKDDSKKNSVIVKKEPSLVSANSRKDVSINSDPPSLEGRSFSNPKPYTPFPTRYSRDRSMHNPRASQYRQPVTGNKKERSSADWSSKAGDDDSDVQGVKGMFKLWGKKFNLEEDNYNKMCTPKPSCNPARTEGIKKNEIAIPRIQEPSPPIQPAPKHELEPETDKKKEGRRFFFFKNKKKDKHKEKEKEKPFKAKKGVTTGRCEVRDGLVIKILGDNVYNPEKICKEPEIIHNDNEEIVRKSWLKKFLTPTIDSRNSVNVRWNNKTYAPSSSTVFELMDNIYKDTSIVFRSKSQVSVQSSYRSHKRQHVNFMKQNIEAWMIPKTFTDRPKLLPVKHIQHQLTCKSDEDTKDNMEVRISDQKWFIDKSKAFSHKIEVVLHSKNFKKLYKEESSEYLRIEIPKGFFVDSSTDEVTKPAANQSSDEEVFKIVEYETGSDLKKDKGTHNPHVRDYKQNKIKVTVSVKESTKCVSKVLETSSPKPMNRDVILQGSNVFIPKRCDIVGVGIITHRDLSQIRKPILKIQDDFSDEESEHNLLEPNTKKCEFAESYLQEYYRHWTPLGIDLYSWCASDSQLRCCSEHSISSFQNQGDVTKSCPNIFEDFQTATIVSSCGASSCSGTLQYKPQNMSDPSESGGKKKKKKEKEKKPDADRRVLPKDSIEVFKRRKIYAATNKSKWVTPWVPDSLQASGVPSVDSKCGDQNSTLHVCPKPPRKSCCRQKEQSKSKRHVCKKHVSLPDCDTMNNALTKQLGTVIPESILAFKGAGGCDICNKKKDSFVKHATLNPNASCEIPRAPCRDSCEQMKKSPCASAKQSCEKPPPCHRQCPIPRAPCESPKPSCQPKPCPPRPAYPPPKPACPPPKPICPPPKPACPPSKPACPPPRPAYPPPKPACPPPKPRCPQPKPACPQPKPACPQPKPSCPQPKPACPPPKPACPQPRPCPSPPTPPCPTSPPQYPSPPSCCGKQSPSSSCCKKPSPQRSSHPSCPHIHIVATCPPKPPSPCPHTPPCLPKPQYPPCPPKPQNSPCPTNLPPLLKLTQSPVSPPPTSSPPYTCPHTPPCLPLPNPRPCPPPAVPCTPPPRSPQSPQSPPKCPHSPPCSPLPEPCCCPPKPPSPPSFLPSPPSSPHSSPCRPSTPSCPCGQQEEKPLAPIMKRRQCRPPSPPCGGFNTKECPMAPPSCPITPPQCCTDPKRCPYSPPPCSKKTSSCKKLCKKKLKSDTKCPASSPCKPLPCQPSFCKSLACQQSMTSVSYTALRPDAPFYYSPIHPCAPDIVPEPKKQCNTPPCNPNDEFPWPTKNQVSNQSSNTSLCENSQESFGKCKKDCPMMPKMSCETVPSVKECKPSCPNFGGSPRLPCLSKIPGMQCPPPPQPCPSPPAEPIPSSPPPPIPCRSKSKVSGLFLKMMPAPKKTTCSKDCSAWENGLREDCISLNSTEKITIRLKKQTPSTAEIRECLNIKVQDEDEMTLFERKDYSFQHADCGVQRQPSLLGEMYKASEVRRVTTNNSTQAIGADKEIRKEIKEVPSEASVANLIEIQFKLKVTQGDKTTEINIANDGDKENRERKEPMQKSTPEVFVVKNEDERSAEHSDQKNDINIRIVIKNFKSKPGKKKFVNLKQDDYNDFSKNISAKFHTVSTGYSDVFHDDHVFSVHRATVDLTSSVENTKTDTTSMHSYKTEHSMKNVHSNKSVHGNKSDHSIKDWQSNKSVHSNKTALTKHGELINPSEHTKHVHSIKSVHGNKSDHSIKDDHSNKNDHNIKSWLSNKSVHNNKTALTKHGELINPSEHTEQVHSNKSDHSIKGWQSNKSEHSNKTALTKRSDPINPSEHTEQVHSNKSEHGKKSDHSIKGWQSNKTALIKHSELIHQSEHTKQVHSNKIGHGNKSDHSIKSWQSNKSVHSDKTGQKNHSELIHHSEHTKQVHSNKSVHGKKSDHSIKGWHSNKSVHSNKTVLTNHSELIHQTENTKESVHGNKSDHSVKSWQSNKSVHGNKTALTKYSELIHQSVHSYKSEHTKQVSVHSYKSVYSNRSAQPKQSIHSNRSVEIINEPRKRRHFIGSSEASVCRCITTEDEKSGEDTDAKSCPSLKYSNTKETQDNADETDTQVTDHKYEYNEDTDTEKPIKYDTEETDTDRQVDHPKYDTETDTEKRQDGKYDTFMSTTDTDEPDTLPEIRKSQSLDVIGKPKTKEEKKQMLKHIMEKVHDTKFKNKTRMRKLRDMLKVILTSDSSDHDDTKVKVPPNDLAKDVTYASLKPNYFRDTDSMHKYYEVDSTAVLSNATINGQIVYPSAENNSDCSNSVRSGDVISSDNVDSSRKEGCMCSTVAARLKLAARIGEVRGCCCSSKPMTKKSEETICDLKRESDYHVQIDNMTTEFVDVHTQNSRYLTSKLNSTNLSAHSSIKAGKSVSFNFEEGVNVGSGVLNVDSRQLNLKKTISPEKFHLRECEMRKRNRNAILNVSDDEKIVLRSGHSTRLQTGHGRTRDEKQDLQHAADILQSYEAKKAVLEIYTEKTISDDGERLVAKLPKFVYDREQEIHANYEAMANNTYKSVCKKNFIMMAIKR